jgi:flagellar motility protein MotE (MotC chaperone)
MIRAAFLVVLALLFASVASECARAWGWEAEEGIGGASVKPHPAPKQAKGWSPKVVAPAPPPRGAPAPGTPAREPAEAAQKTEEAPLAKPVPPPETPATVKSYCDNIADQALDARFLAQKAELTRLEEELAKRTAFLEAKKTEYQEWLKRRDEFVSKAETTLVKLYAKIKPDAAAPQLAAMDEEAAAALLLKLSPKASSAILDQMDSAKAARLASIIIGAARPGDKPPRPARSAPAEQASEGKKEAGQPENGDRKS